MIDKEMEGERRTSYGKRAGEKEENQEVKG